MIYNIIYIYTIYIIHIYIYIIYILYHEDITFWIHTWDPKPRWTSHDIDSDESRRRSGRSAGGDSGEGVVSVDDSQILSMK